jgi:3-phenylpropionate/cinnamic acid dioxygenase small subunit
MWWARHGCWARRRRDPRRGQLRGVSHQARRHVSEVYNVGRYIDDMVRNNAGLLFAGRRCVYDSEMVLNSLIYPV